MRVVIGEDNVLLREGLIRLMEIHGLHVVATADNGPDLYQVLLREHPDVAVVDVRMPPTQTDDGLRAAIGARSEIPGLPILVLSQYVEPLYAKELLSDRTGGVGYLLKERVAEVSDFIDAVGRVAQGGTAMDPEVVLELLASRGKSAPLERLTAREREVLSLMAQGRSNCAIASRLFVTERAIAKHTANIFIKLDLPPSDGDNRRVLAVLAYLGG